ncbi:MAG: ATP-binding protein [Verrucomicrobiota bacterium]
MTLWYAGILCASMLVLTGLSYKHFLNEQRDGKRAIAIGEFLKTEMEDWDDVMSMVLWFGLPTALIGLAGGWFLMRKAMSPVVALTHAAEKINDRNLREQLARSGNGDELDRLTEVFNAMTTRLDDSFQRIREFTLHASHELKTPLTVMRGEIETALRDESLAATQRERLHSQLDEIERLTKIVNGLTLLTKADAGLVQLKREPVQLDELVRDNFEDAKILAEPFEISVCLEKCDPAIVHGDRDRLRQLLLNLTDNAIKYNRPSGIVTIALTCANDQAEIKITNTGAGIPAEMLPRIFQRFFRVDESHNNSVDGCGLGLSISKWIATAHDGSIELNSDPGKLTTAIVRLRLSPVR